MLKKLLHNKREMKRFSFTGGLVLVLVGAAVIGLAVSGIVGADVTTTSQDIAALKSLALFGGGMVVASMVLWAVFFSS